MTRPEVRKRFDEIERLAASGKEMEPQDPGLPDTWLFWSMQILYREFRAGYINREQARKRKNALLSQYDLQKFYERCGAWCAETRKKTQAVLMEAQKSDCPICHKLVMVFDGRDGGSE